MLCIASRPDILVGEPTAGEHNMNASQLIVFLNSLGVGDIDGISAKLEEARQSCLALQQEELAGRLATAREALRETDVKTYRVR
jgi:hypothetical protein